MYQRCIRGVIIILALNLEGASANDTIANFAAGGLTFSRTDAIGMISEDLYLSPSEVRVTYRFRNLTNEDVAGTVAFPMPDIALASSDASYPDGPANNPMRFSVTVDGRAIPVQLEKKATADKKDVTDVLQSFHLPLEPYSEVTTSRLKQLDSSTVASLKDKGLVDVEEYQTGGGRQTTTLIPKWNLSAIYHWQQKFPAGRELLVQHRYKPSVGGAVVSLSDVAKATSENGLLLQSDGACVDDTFIVAARKWASRQRQNNNPRQVFVDYILTSGANWAGPIGTFTLTVDKQRPENVVSFCAEDVRTISPTRFQMIKTNFTPKQDIRVLILTNGT